MLNSSGYKTISIKKEKDVFSFIYYSIKFSY